MKEKGLSFGLTILALPGILGALPAWAENPAKHSDAASPERYRYESDNTGINTRDRSNHAVLPMDQSNRSDLVKVSADIRAALSRNSELSTYAHNVKIITTEDGRTWLRGPVISESERNEVARIAREVAGQHEVVDELEVLARSGSTAR